MTDVALIPNSVSPARPAPRGVPILVSLVAAAVAFTFSWPTRHGDFLHGDDHGLVLEHVFINNPSLKHAWRLLTMVHGDLFQPLPMLSFQANYAMAGPDPAGKFPVSSFGFHLTNIILHALNAALAAAIALRLSRCARIALLTGVMFACHPLAQEPVAWITGRMILLATFFSLILMLVTMARREDASGAWSLWAILAWLGALLSKVLPSVPAAAAWCDFNVHRRFPRRWWATYALLMGMAAVAAYLAVESTKKIGLIEITQAEMTTSTPVRMLLASRYYFENYLWPTRMSAWSPPPEHVPFLSIRAAIAIVEWIAVILVAALAWRRARLISVGIVLFVILIAPFLAATAARNFLTADRYMYLPMLGLHLAAAGALVQVVESLKRRVQPALAQAIVYIPLLVVFTLWMHIGWRQAGVWANGIGQGLRALEVYPDDWRVRAQLARDYTIQGIKYRSLGNAHEAEKSFREAMAVIAEARRLWPDEHRISAHAGEALRELGRHEEAMAELETAVGLMSDNHRARYYLGLTYETLGRPDDARACYERILTMRDNFLPAITALARNHRAAGRIDEAIATFEKAIAINRFHRDSLFELALLQIRRGEWAAAAGHLSTIIDFDPGDAEAALNLGACLTRLNRLDEALAVFDRLLERHPDAVTARLNRAEILAAAGRAAEAETDYRQILAADPSHRDAAIGLHGLLQARHRYDELVKLWTSVLNAASPPRDVQAWLAWSYALLDDSENVEQHAAAVSGPETGLALVQWATVYLALRHGENAALLSALRREELAPTTTPGVAAREHGPLVRAALSDLPEERRNSAYGLYTAARALAHEGDFARAAVLANAVLSTPDGAPLHAAARELLTTATAPADRK